MSIWPSLFRLKLLFLPAPLIPGDGSGMLGVEDPTEGTVKPPPGLDDDSSSSLDDTDGDIGCVAVVDDDDVDDVDEHD